MRPDVKIRLVGERIFYGPGAHQLLSLTAEEGSLRGACSRMGVSYSKGRRIISILEQQIGYPVMESRQGGKDGGYSVVTEEGRELIRRYDSFTAEASRKVQALFEEHFSDML